MNADEAEQLGLRIRRCAFGVEREQVILGHRFRPYRREDLELARVQETAVHKVGFLVADDFDGFFEPRFVKVPDRLLLLVHTDGEQRRPVFAEVRHAIDLRISFDEGFEAETRLAVIIEIERRGQLVEFLGPLQGPATVIVLEHPLAAKIQAGDCEPTEQGGGQYLDGQDFVHQDTLAAIASESEAPQPLANRMYPGP